MIPCYDFRWNSWKENKLLYSTSVIEKLAQFCSCQKSLLRDGIHTKEIWEVKGKEQDSVLIWTLRFHCEITSNLGLTITWKQYVSLCVYIASLTWRSDTCTNKILTNGGESERISAVELALEMESSQLYWGPGVCPKAVVAHKATSSSPSLGRD